MQYLLYVLVCFLGFAAAGILGAFVAVSWSEILDNRFSRLIIDIGNFGTKVDDIRISVAAMSVSNQDS